MKRLSFIILLYSMSLLMGFSQQSKIFIQVLQMDLNNVPTEAKMHLKNKMKQLISSNGIADEDPNNRFVITAKALIKTKDIILGPPQKVSINVDFVFYIGDIVENKVFENITFSSTGVGLNENKAFIMAINNIKPRSKDMVSFLENAKAKIIDYYTLRCSQIISEAEKDAAINDFGAAIYSLMQIPDVCQCSEQSYKLLIDYTDKYNKYTAVKLLNQAKTKWAASPTEDGAYEVMQIVDQIPAQSPVQKELDELLNEIKAKLKSDQQKQWAFEMQQYKDQIEQQKRDDEYRAKQQAADNAYRDRQQMADNVARHQLIDACRQVGLAYARHQPRNVYVTYQRNVILW